MSRRLEVLVLGILLIFAIQYIYVSSTTNAQYVGTDDQAGNAIKEITGGNEPSSKPFWQPPTEGVESLLFGLQALIGIGVLGYVFKSSMSKKKI